MACALTEPANARARPSSLIKSEEAYKRIFNADYPLDVYLKCPIIVQAVQDILKNSGNDDYRKHVNNMVFYVAALWALEQSGVPRPSVQQISGIDITKLSSNSILAVASNVWDDYLQYGGTDQVAKGTELSKALLDKYRQRAIEAIKGG
jgi:hypothetical protein